MYERVSALFMGNSLYCLQGGKRVPLEDFDIIHWARFLKHSSMWSYILFRVLRSHDFNYDYSCSFLLYFIFLPWQPHSVIDSRYYCRVKAHMTARCSHDFSLLRASLFLCSEWHNGHLKWHNGHSPEEKWDSMDSGLSTGGFTNTLLVMMRKHKIS